MPRVVIAYGERKDGTIVPLYTGSDADTAETAIFLAGHQGKIETGYLVRNPGWERRFADFGPGEDSPPDEGEASEGEPGAGPAAGDEGASPSQDSAGAEPGETPDAEEQGEARLPADESPEAEENYFGPRKGGKSKR
jgi:hypothetical protein